MITKVFATAWLIIAALAIIGLVVFSVGIRYALIIVIVGLAFAFLTALALDAVID